MACCGWPVRNQYDALPPPPPAPPVEPPEVFGPEVPQAARPAASAPPAVTRRKVRRDVVMGSTLISVLRGRGPGPRRMGRQVGREKCRKHLPDKTMFRNVGFGDVAVKALNSGL